jgi:hypothetical protein
MKCPKCGFISFDYNETCPKCKKDISGEREKMHHIPFKPAVPFLIGALIGEAADSQANLEIREPGIPMPLDSGLFDMESISAKESREIGLGSSPELGQTREDFLPVEDEEIALGLEDLDLDRDDVLAEPGSTPPSATPDAAEESLLPESPTLDEDTLSIELADLLEIEPESEGADDEYVNEEALTIEMESAEHDLEEPSPVEVEELELTPEPEEFSPVEEGPPVEIEELELTPEPKESPPFTEIDDLETDNEVPHDLAPDTPPPYQEDADILFSLNDLKEDKIGDYRIPDELPQLPGKKPDAASSSGAQSSEPSGVWTEIAKDLEDLNFDIDDSN